MPLKLKVITPERSVCDETVDEVALPGAEGEFVVLPKHEPLIALLTPGELRYIRDGKDEHLAVGEGYCEVARDFVNVVTDIAMSSDEIQEDEALEAIERAEKAMLEKKHDPEEVLALQASLRKNVAKLNLKRKFKNKMIK